MAVSRPLLLALVGMLLAGATFYAAKGARDSAAEPSAAPATPASTVTPAPARDGEAPPLRGKGLAALPEAKPLKSGRLRVRMVQRGGSEPGSLAIDATFQSQGASAVPQFDIELRQRDADGERRAGAVSTGDEAFVSADGRASRVGAPAFEVLTELRPKIAAYAGRAGGSERGPLGLDYTRWLTGAKSERGPRIDGAPTVRLSGQVDWRRAAKDLAKLDGPAAGGLSVSKGQLRKLVKARGAPRLVVFAGASDGIARRMTLATPIVEGAKKGHLRFEAKLAGVNRPQAVSSPKPTGAAASELPRDSRNIAWSALATGVLGVDLPGLSEARAAGFDGAGSSKPTDKGKPEARGLPKPVARALGGKRVVVLFFRQRRGADDAATAEAVAAVEGLRGVSVFRDAIKRLARYRSVVAGLGVAQAPAVVVADRRRNAQLVEGFVDEGTLRQLVLDAR